MLEAVAGLGEEVLSKLVTTWQEMGIQSALIGDQVIMIMMIMMTMHCNGDHDEQAGNPLAGAG